MSVQEEITRIKNAKSDIKDAIEAKGVEVGDGLINTYASKVSQISTGVPDQAYPVKEYRVSTGDFPITVGESGDDWSTVNNFQIRLDNVYPGMTASEWQTYTLQNNGDFGDIVVTYGNNEIRTKRFGVQFGDNGGPYNKPENYTYILGNSDAPSGASNSLQYFPVEVQLTQDNLMTTIQNFELHEYSTGVIDTGTLYVYKLPFVNNSIKTALESAGLAPINPERCVQFKNDSGADFGGTYNFSRSNMISYYNSVWQVSNGEITSKYKGNCQICYLRTSTNRNEEHTLLGTVPTESTICVYVSNTATDSIEDVITALENNMGGVHIGYILVGGFCDPTTGAPASMETPYITAFRAIGLLPTTNFMPSIQSLTGSVEFSLASNTNYENAQIIAANMSAQVMLSTYAGYENGKIINVTLMDRETMENRDYKMLVLAPPEADLTDVDFLTNSMW